MGLSLLNGIAAKQNTYYHEYPSQILLVGRSENGGRPNTLQQKKTYVLTS